MSSMANTLRIEATAYALSFALKSSALSIQDWPELGECELHILGIEEPRFESLFAEHPDYKAYKGEA